MGKCSVPFCRGNATFTFPKDEKRRVLWEKAINVNFRASKSSRLCPNHFEKDMIVEKNESYYTGVISSKKTLKPNAIPTLMLELELEKSKRSEKIRKVLFEEDSNDSNSSSSSSLCLSLLNNSPHVSENVSTNIETTLIDVPTENYMILSLPNYIKQVTAVPQTLKHKESTIQTNFNDYHVSKNLLTSSAISNNSTISDMSSILNFYYNIDKQTEKAILTSISENNQSAQIESTQLKSLIEKQRESSIDKKKTYSSVGIQVGCGSLSVNLISHRDDVIHYYTGLATYATFQFVYGTLSNCLHHIEHIKEQINFMEPEDMFLLTLMKLRRNIPDFGLSFYFGISEAFVHNIFNSWIHYIYQLWSLLDTWPSREVVDFYMPDGFRKFYPSTTVIVDATELPSDKLSNSIVQQATFNANKNENRVHIERLVGLTKNYKILREPLNSDYICLATKIFSICLMLCNFRESFVGSVL